MDLFVCFQKEDNTIICTCPKRFQYIGLDHTMECRKCSVCPAGYGVKYKCTIYNDTVCEKCKAGYYSRRGSKYCKKCRECPENYDVIHVCTFDHNTRCKPCKQGRYYSKEKKQVSKMSRMSSWFIHEETMFCYVKHIV